MACSSRGSESQLFYTYGCFAPQLFDAGFIAGESHIFKAQDHFPQVLCSLGSRHGVFTGAYRGIVILKLGQQVLVNCFFDWWRHLVTATGKRNPQLELLPLLCNVCNGFFSGLHQRFTKRLPHASSFIPPPSFSPFRSAPGGFPERRRSSPSGGGDARTGPGSGSRIIRRLAQCLPLSTNHPRPDVRRLCWVLQLSRKLY